MKTCSSLSHRITSSPHGMRVWQQERVISDVTERVCELMSQQGVNRSQLADRLGKTKGYVTHLLRGDANLTLRTVSDVYLALGRQFEPSDSQVSIANDGATIYEFCIVTDDAADDAAYADDDIPVTVKVS